MKEKPKRKYVKKQKQIEAPKAEVPAVIENPTTQLITEKTITRYMDAFGIASQLTDAEKRQFIEIAKAYQLNPFKREIYATPYETSVKNPDGTWGKVRKLSLVTGYEVYLKRATRLAVIDGWNVITAGDGDNMKAVCTIYRKDWKFPFIHEVAFSEYKQTKSDGKLTKFWSEKPKTMLKKVAVSQAFRLCFPDEMGGMPYTADELPPNMSKEYSEPIKIEDKTEPAAGEDTDDDKEKAKKEAELKAKIDKISALPDDVKEGFKILGYNGNNVYLFCEKFGWDARRILVEVNKIIDMKESQKDMKNV